MRFRRKGAGRSITFRSEQRAFEIRSRFGYHRAMHGSHGGSPPRAQAGRLLSWPAQALLVFRKDLRLEVRSGQVTVTSTFFAALMVILASLSLFGGPQYARVVSSGVIWLSITFAAVLALGRAFQREREESALDGLLVAPLSRSALFAGKALGVLVFLLIMAAVVIPLTSLLFALDLERYGPGLVLLALFALPGVAASGT